MRNILVVAAATLIAQTVGLATVQITPPSAIRGKAQEYILKVKNDTKAVTVSIQLDAPDGVSIADAPDPEVGTVEIKQEGSRISSIIWTREIKPAATADFRFVVRNPTIGEEIVWPVIEKKANGSLTKWVGKPKQKNAAPVTKLTPSDSEPPDDGGRPIDTR